MKPGPKSCSTSASRGAIEQREHLVILAPQFAQPLHRQRLRRDHEAALDLLRVQQAIHDERRLDRLAQPDFVGEQPSHREPHGRALGHVQLVREQAHASAEEGAKTVRLACRQQVQDVEARQEVVRFVYLAGSEALDERQLCARRALGSR